MELEGEDRDGVIGAVEFIEELRLKQHFMKVPKKVVVIGGGNTAMDAASESARMGASKTVLAYRNSKEKMKAYGFEYDLAISILSLTFSSFDLLIMSFNIVFYTICR